jgi:hypothetical protein
MTNEQNFCEDVLLSDALKIHFKDVHFLFSQRSHSLVQ